MYIILFHIILKNNYLKEEVQWKISRKLAWKLPPKYYANLCSGLKNLINSKHFQDSSKRNENDFIRNRSLPFIHVFSSILMCNPGPLNTRIRRFFDNFDDTQNKPPSKSALCQARNKLLPQAFEKASTFIVDSFYLNKNIQTWNNFRVLSIDGSTVKLPKSDEIIEEFGLMHPRQGEPCSLARFSMVTDTLNGLTIDAQLKPWKAGEISVAFDHLSHIDKNDIVVLDRGYRSIALLYKIQQNGAHFCHRINISRWKFAQDFLKSNQDDMIITMPLTYSTKKDLKDTWNISIDTFTFRAIKVKLGTGETEILITSIMDKKLTKQDFYELYGHRWPIEETYKIHKTRTVIESFSGKKVNVIYQDFYAKILLANIGVVFSCKMQSHIDKQTEELEHVYNLNLTECLRIINEKMYNVIYETNIFRIVKQMIDRILLYIEPVRPNRKYDRNFNERRKRYNPNYIPVS